MQEKKKKTNLEVKFFLIYGSPSFTSDTAVFTEFLH